MKNTITLSLIISIFTLSVSASAVNFTDVNQTPEENPIRQSLLLQDNPAGVLNTKFSMNLKPSITNYSKTENLQYISQEYGFSINFPNQWSGFFGKKRVVFDDNFAKAIIDIGFAEQNSLFAIIVYSQAQWEKLQEEGGPIMEYLGENEKYVFAYEMAQDTVSEKMYERWLEINEIMQTFKLK